MDYLLGIINFFLHIDVYLGQLISAYGLFVYLILFFVIFIETGLVFTPFLPGDSLLFAAGAFAALGSLNIWVVIVILATAAIFGDTANYWIGHFFGEKLLENPNIPINKKHIAETKVFFEKHGGKTIILARFIPIVRTFAPFVAGIGKMTYGRFISFNVVGGTLWVLIATLSGYFFGNIPAVQKNFSLIILAIVAISVFPLIFPLLKKKLSRANPDRSA